MITLGSIKDQVAKVLNVCASDARVAEYVNRAERRLLPTGHWVGSVRRYRVCTNDACLTWPRQIETIEGYTVDDHPGTIRNSWFEFIGNGPGGLKQNCYAGMTLVDRGLACAFDDVRWNGTTPPQLLLYADDANDVGARVLLKFFDSNGQKVYSFDTVSGRTIEGVFVTVVAPPAYATVMILDENGLSTGTPFTVLRGGLYEVQKPVTNGVFRLYCYDPLLFTQYPLAYYEPSETLPEYRRSMIPYLTQMASCSRLPCQSKNVTVMAKMRHVDVMVDTDSLVLTCEEALLEEVDAIQLGEPPARDIAGSETAHQRAMRLLQEQLSSFEGDGAVVAMRFQDAAVFGGGGVPAYNSPGYW